MRPFDDQSQPRIHLETLAVSLIMDSFRTGDWWWVAGEVLLMEVLADRNQYRRTKVLQWLGDVKEWVDFSRPDDKKMEMLVRHGIGEWDAEHLVTALIAKCDYFVSTDRDLLVRAARLKPALAIRLRNPVELAENLP
jgi:hypothetical protein